MTFHGQNSCQTFIKCYIFTIYETLFENVITILPIAYQNKTKMLKNRKSLVYLKKVSDYTNYIQAI